MNTLLTTGQVWGSSKLVNLSHVCFIQYSRSKNNYGQSLPKIDDEKSVTFLPGDETVASRTSDEKRLQKVKGLVRKSRSINHGCYNPNTHLNVEKKTTM